MASGITHEQFIHRIRAAAVAGAGARATISEDEARRLLGAKVVYGVGDGRYRGVCHYDSWQNVIGQAEVVEIAASCEESAVQLAGTTLHELAHVLAGWQAGHRQAWKAACERLGLRLAEASGQRYLPANLTPAIRALVAELAPTLGDGSPKFHGNGSAVVSPPAASKLCPAGIGTRGGTSRGKGSESRLRLWVCGCTAGAGPSVLG